MLGIRGTPTTHMREETQERAWAARFCSWYWEHMRRPSGVPVCSVCVHWSLHICMCAHTCLCTCVCVCVHMCLCMCVHIARVHTHTSGCARTHMRVGGAHTCMCVGMHACAHMCERALHKQAPAQLASSSPRRARRPSAGTMLLLGVRLMPALLSQRGEPAQFTLHMGAAGTWAPCSEAALPSRLPELLVQAVGLCTPRPLVPRPQGDRGPTCSSSGSRFLLLPQLTRNPARAGRENCGNRKMMDSGCSGCAAVLNEH